MLLMTSFPCECWCISIFSLFMIRYYKLFLYLFIKCYLILVNTIPKYLCFLSLLLSISGVVVHTSLPRLNHTTINSINIYHLPCHVTRKGIPIGKIPCNVCHKFL
ncbi:hypothetical protein, unlikely [Trypanosoma brucei gambiense DAL972]|uniref:Uncharacterized protein n=1 Tax=Trypanosoma brucei gambiense (strain MHOM/CI/86/DAL972) TaxID=679716 RepID=C9ZSA9_TRYB9|nr:hypothetical protein, unlikely [Trypanosoma brucei gambiense DAL972]CBH12245.1 hypothetical protein, unlikely [Trypanosoma brucei gambiense DAL972]|eukprot:XP_011774528.1 hypothetical protein, unlikely [Trypanosoma brucei gambiense DAL972]